MHPVENVEELVESVGAQVAKHHILQLFRLIMGENVNDNENVIVSAKVAKHHILQLLRLITFVVFVVDDGANIVAVKSCLVVMFQTDLLVDFDNAEGY